MPIFTAGSLGGLGLWVAVNIQGNQEESEKSS